MATPAGIGAGLKGLELAAKEIKGLIDKAQDARAAEVDRTVNYLRAAREAVWSLEQECAGILSAAARCDLDDAAAVHQLIQRIEHYLHVDLVRPHLLAALAGLSVVQGNFHDHATRYRSWPWRNANRAAAVARFTELLDDLVDYLHELDQGTRHMAAGTGPQAWRIRQLQIVLLQLHEKKIDARQARAQLDSIVSDARQDPKKGGWLDLTRRVEELNADLYATFA